MARSYSTDSILVDSYIEHHLDCKVGISKFPPRLGLGLDTQGIPEMFSGGNAGYPNGRQVPYKRLFFDQGTRYPT